MLTDMNCLRFMLFLGLMLPAVGSAQLSRREINDLTSPIDSSRSSTFERIRKRGATERFPVCSPDASRSTRDALIAALVKQNSVVFGRRSVNETETEYLANLIGCVAALRTDSALRPLLDALETGYGAINGVVALGDHAVPQVAALAQAREARTGKRTAAALTLGRFLEPGPATRISPQSRAIARAALIGALRDDNAYVRKFAVEGLKPIADAEVRSEIRRVASSDPGLRIGKETLVRYPARDAALAWLREDSLRLRKPVR